MRSQSLLIKDNLSIKLLGVKASSKAGVTKVVLEKLVTTPFEAQRAKALSMEREKNSRLVSTKLKEIFIKFWEYPDTKSTFLSTILSPKR